MLVLPLQYQSIENIEQKSWKIKEDITNHKHKHMIHICVLDLWLFQILEN